MTERTAVQRAERKAAVNQIVEKAVRAITENSINAILSPALFEQIDKWIAGQTEPAIDRPEAIRRLVEIGLKTKG